MVKLTKRKAFNFFRSYYDVYNELSNKDKVSFMDALLDRQFLGVKPEGLKGMANFAYISQTNSIDSQVKGYETKIEGLEAPTEAPTEGGNQDPTAQVQEKGKGKEQEKEELKQEKEKSLIGEFNLFWNLYDKKVDKDKCLKKWRSLKDKEKDHIAMMLANYVKSTPEARYRKNPLTWLNGKCWNDEIIENSKGNIIGGGGIKNGQTVFPRAENAVPRDPDAFGKKSQWAIDQGL